MPRGARPLAAGRPQTLREARRAYQKAGRVPSLSAAQIRAAERAVEADKRAKDILAKEKRAREAKKKKEEQEAKQREEQRNLVQLGRLPEESLWGKVRASQPRLHSFFGAPPERKVEPPSNKVSLEIQGQKSDARARSVGDSAETSQGSGRILSSAPAALNSQKISCLPVLQTASPLKVCIKQHTTQAKHAYEWSAVHAVAADRGQMDSQFCFLGSQLLSGFADDEALEVELNGQFLPPIEVCDSSIHTSRRTAAFRTGSTSRKRKAEDRSPTTTSSVKAARTTSAQRPPSMLKTCALEIASASSGSSLTQPGVHPPATVVSVDDIPTASQVEAMFWSQDSEGNDRPSDKENLDPRPVGSKIISSTPQTKSIKSAAAEFQRPPPSTVKLLFKEKSSSKQSALRPQEDDGVLDNGHGPNDYSDSVFSDDFDAELLNLPSQISGFKKDTSQMLSKPLSAEAPILQRSTPPKLAKQGSPLPSVGDLPQGTQDSYYDMQGVNDEDLLGLAAMYNSSQNFG